MHVLFEYNFHECSLFNGKWLTDWSGQVISWPGTSVSSNEKWRQEQFTPHKVAED